MRLKPITRLRKNGQFVKMHTDGLSPAQRMERRNPGYGADRQRKYRERHPDRVLKAHQKRVQSGALKIYYRTWNRKRRCFLIEPLLKVQGGCCAICKRPMPRPNLDHNHKCCKPKGGGGSGCAKCRRGLLCGSCNGGLHLVESKRLHKAAIQYLKYWETQWKTRNT